MKYLKIKNKGELDPRLVCLMGASTKTDEPTKIGQFGTGLKYAISFMLRNGIDFRLFCGNTEVLFTLQETTIANKDFQEILCNGQTMNITTQYGYQWKPWEALREIWCNALDEGDYKRSVIEGRNHTQGKEGETTFYVQVTEAIAEVIEKWNEYFINEQPLFENDEYAIYPNTGKLKLYKHGVLIYESTYKDSMFRYDIKNATLNELRQFLGGYEFPMCRAISQSTSDIGKQVIEAIREKKKVIETELTYWSFVNAPKEQVREVFSGYLYLHSTSADSASKSGVKVSDALFEMLKGAGLPCERLMYSSGGGYGGFGSGFSPKEEAIYREVVNKELQARIEATLKKYSAEVSFKIVVFKKDALDISFENDMMFMNVALFNNDLKALSDADLEATVIIAIMHMQEANIYKAFRRLIKSTIKNRNFKKMLFGRNIGENNKPRYIAPVVVSNDDDEDLPF